MKTKIDDLNRYLVGGAVRNKSLGIPVHDHDYVVVGSSPEEMFSLGFKEISAKSFPVFHHPVTGDEWALARRERWVDGGFEFVTKGVTLEEDLCRRDFTMNAMAMDDDDNIMDPLSGANDIQYGVIRHIEDDAFAEDKCRIIRAARFASELNFTIAPSTIVLCRRMCMDGALDSLPRERLWAETKKALKRSKKPSEYFRALDALGALDKVFTELKCMQLLPEHEMHHGEGTTFNHTMLALDYAARYTDKIGILWAAVCHDFGKLLTPIDERPKYSNHANLGKVLVKDFCSRIGVERNVKHFSVLAARHHMKYHLFQEMKPSKIIKMLNEMGVRQCKKKLVDFIEVCRADYYGRKNRKPDENIAIIKKNEIYLHAVADIMKDVKGKPELGSPRQIQQAWIQEVVLCAKQAKLKIYDSSS